MNQHKKIVKTVTGDLAYDEIGSGEKTVILIHGFGSDGRIWKYFQEYLKNDYSLIIPDLPGFGDSQLKVKDDLTIDLMAESINELCIVSGIKKPVIIGHSMGGYVALAFLEKYPEKLSGIGLFHSHVYKDGTDRVGNRQKAINFIQKNGSKFFIKEFYKTIFHTQFREEHAEIYAEFKAFAEEIDPASLVSATYAMMKRPDRSVLLENCKIPALFLYGKYDEPMPLELCMQQVSLPDYSHLHILKKSGHMGMLEQPEESANAVCQFLERL